MNPSFGAGESPASTPRCPHRRRSHRSPVSGIRCPETSPPAPDACALQSASHSPFHRRQRLRRQSQISGLRLGSRFFRRSASSAVTASTGSSEAASGRHPRCEAICSPRRRPSAPASQSRPDAATLGAAPRYSTARHMPRRHGPRRSPLSKCSLKAGSFLHGIL